MGKILRIDHRLDKNFKVVAIAKYKGLGSIIQATPLLQTLRIKYPQAKIIFVTTKGNLTLLKEIDCIDEVIHIDDRNIFTLIKTFPGFLIKLIKRRVDLYLDLEIYSNFSSFITTLSMAKNRAGYFLRSSNYRLGIYTHMMYYNIRVPIFQTYLQFARLLNCERIIESLFELKSDSYLINLNQTSFDLRIIEYILINPNASDLRLERRWDSSNYLDLIPVLKATYPQVKIILIGGKDESDYVDQIYSKLKDNNNIYNLAGKTNIKQLISLIQYAKVFITNDTGPMHIGFSLKTKIVALFGPCAPVQYGGNANCYSIYHKVYCSPCVHEFIVPPCGGDNQCMKLIKVSEVVKGVNSMFNSIQKEEELKSNNIYDIINEDGSVLPLGIVKRS